ncbi:MAG: PAS domain S-box protein [Verrucomicrobiales bacterium]|nr:PAS domain S-box protein [Verrucomicrobiales bacterium]
MVPATGSPRVLGELLATPALLLSLPSPDRVAEFVARTLQHIPGVAASRICLAGGSAESGDFDTGPCDGCVGMHPLGDDAAELAWRNPCRHTGREDCFVRPLRVTEGLMGFAVVRYADRLEFGPYEPFVENFFGFVALSLENVRQESELRRLNERLRADIEQRARVEEELREHRGRLEELVAARTESLSRLNDLLRKEARDRENAEERSRYLAAIVTSSDDAIIGKDLEGRIVSWNRGAERIYGHTAAETVGQSIQFLAPADRAQEASDLMRQLQEAGSVRDFETVRLRKDGTRIDVRLTISQVLDAEGRVVGASTIARDITERKRAEMALRQALEGVRESEELYRKLIQASPDAITVAELDGTITLVSPRAIELFGLCENESAVGRNLFEWVAPEDHDRAAATIRDLVEIGAVKQSEFMLLRGCGGRFEAEVNVALLRSATGAAKGMIIITRDISARRRAEQQLRMLSRAVDQSPASIVITDLTGSIEYVNAAFTTVTGYERAEVVGKNPRVLKSGTMSAEHYGELWRTILEGREWRGEFSNRRKNGEMYWERASISPIRDARGEITHFLAIKEDITARRQDQERIREQAALLDQTQDIILVLGLDGRLRYGNRRAVGAWELDPATVDGDEIARRLFPEQPDRFEEVFRAVRDSGRWLGELSVATASGERAVHLSRWTLIHATDEGMASVLIINTDITEKKRLEEQILRSQRLEGVGTLACGVAHDLNNILAPILLSTELLEPLATTAEDREVLAMMAQGVRRGSEIVRQLLAFGRGVEGERVTLHPEVVIEEMAKIIRETFPKSLSLKTAIPWNLWPIRADPTQMHQVLLNLCVNARDAMPNGGRLLLGAENIEVDEAFAAENPEAKAGRYVSVFVVDDGTGISSENLERIFDPFFTTKEPGKGTGLGLSTVLGIVKSHGGFVRVKSRVGEGTRVRCYLPAAAETVEIEKIVDRPSPDAPRGHGQRILVVDDELAVREIARRTLEAHGYRVDTAADGAEALQVFSKSAEPFGAVITDMVMPVMEGAVLIRALARLAPGIPVIAMSGLPELEATAHETGVSSESWLPKPFTAEAMLVVLDRVLGGGAPAER